MAIEDILAGLGGIGEGYLRGTSQLQSIQGQQYANALRMLAAQQAVQQQQGLSTAGQALQYLPQNIMGQPDQGASAQPQFSGLPGGVLPQVPPATAQMDAPGGGLPGIVSQLESGGGRDIASQPPSMVDPLYGQYKGFADQYGRGAEGVNRFAQAELAAKPDATLGDFYGDYVLGTGRPGTHTLEDLRTTTVPGAQGAYANLLANAGVPPSTPLASLVHQQNVMMKQSGIAPHAVDGASGLALNAGSSVDVSGLGRNRLSALMAAVDKADPSASPAVKFLAVKQIDQLLMPQDKMMLNYLIQSNRDQLRAGIAELQAGTRSAIEAGREGTQRDIAAGREATQKDIAAGREESQRQIKEIQTQAATDRAKMIQDRFDARQQRALDIVGSKQAPQIKARALQDLFNQSEMDIRAYRQNKPDAMPENDDALHDMMQKRDALQRQMFGLLAQGQAAPAAAPSVPPGGAYAPIPPPQ